MRIITFRVKSRDDVAGIKPPGPGEAFRIAVDGPPYWVYWADYDEWRGEYRLGPGDWQGRDAIVWREKTWKKILETIIEDLGW